MDISYDTDEENSVLNRSGSYAHKLDEIDELKHLLDEKGRELELAASLGQHLLGENKRIEEDFFSYKQTTENDVRKLTNKVEYLESLLAEKQNSGTLSVSQMQQERISSLEDRISELEEENKLFKSRTSELISLCENSEKNRFDLLEELDEMKKIIDTFRRDVTNDQLVNKTLKEIVEAQKQALAQAQKVDEEQKKEIHRLHAENSKLANQVESIEDNQYAMSSLEEANQRLKKDASQVKKLATELEFYRSENIELKELLKDKEQLTETIQFLVSENKKYRKEQEEMQQLLEDAKAAAAELRLKMEESVLDKSQTMSGELYQYFEQHYKEISDYVNSKQAKKDKLNVQEWSSETTTTDEKSADWLDSVRKKSNRKSLNEIESTMNSFKKRANTFSRATGNRIRSSSRNALEEKKYLLGSLETKLQSAETKMGQFRATWDEKTKEEVLEDLNNRLKAAEERVRGKENEIERLQQALQRRETSSIPPAITGDKRNVKEGWMLKKGSIIPTWSKRWITLSSVDGRIYYAKSNVDRFLGMIVLRGAYVQQDQQKKSGKDHCFFIMSEFDKRTYYLAAESKEEMESWIKVIQEKINELSFA